MASSTHQEIHVFDNGLKVFKYQLMDLQVERYAATNLHEPEEEAWFRLLLDRTTAHDVFIDVGAAIGYYGILARLLKPTLEVHAFEPLASHQAYMKDNLALNGMSEDDIAIHMEAISSYEGHSSFKSHSFGSSLTHPRAGAASSTDARSWQQHTRAFIRRFKRAFMSRRPGRNSDEIVVTTTTLDTIIKRLGKPIALVKVDVQGFELEVLEGARNSIQRGEIKTWIIGTHSAKIHKTVLQLLTSAGYDILYECEKPEHQPDGIVAAVLPS